MEKVQRDGGPVLALVIRAACSAVTAERFSALAVTEEPLLPLNSLMDFNQ